MDKNEITEEVTVTPVIKDLERLIIKCYRIVVWAIRFAFNFVIDLVQLIFRNIIWFVLITGIGGVVGFFSTHLIPRQYASEMIVQLNVDSKEQLFNDVNYINALIHNQQTETLSEIFGLSTENAQKLTGCEIYAFSSYIEKTQALNELYQGTDTAVFNQLDIGNLLSPGGIDLSSKFRIVFTASEPTVFGGMETSFMTYLERSEELQDLLKTAQSGLEKKKDFYEHEMSQLDTLSAVYNKALIAQAQNGGAVQGGNTTVMFGEPDGKSEMTPLDIRNRRLFYAQRVLEIEKAITEHKSCYFVKGHLSPIGNKIGYGPMARAIVVAFIFFGLTALVFIWRKKDKKVA